MDLEPTDDQVALRDELRRFLDATVTPEARRDVMAEPGAVDRALWGQLAGMGVFGLAVAEADGGVGLGLAEAALAFQELGRVAAPGPLVGTFVAASHGLVPGALDGTAAVGLLPAGAGPALVEHLDAVDAVLVVDAAAPSIAVISGDELRAAAGGAAPEERPLDPLVPVTRVDAVPAGTVVASGDAAAAVLRDVAVLTAAFQVGLGQAAVELGTEYAKQRQQFGRPIGSFQAVKHLLADAVCAVEVARAAVDAAAVTIDEGAPDDVVAAAVASARVVASHAADLAGRACIQVHGGMGYTWELDAHLFLKRAMVLDLGTAGPEAALEELAAAL